MTKIYNNLCPKCGMPMKYFENKEESNPKYSCPYCKNYVSKYNAECIDLKEVKSVNIEIPEITDHCLEEIAKKSLMTKQDVINTILNNHIKSNGTKRICNNN